MEGVMWGLPIGHTELDGDTVLKHMTEWIVHIRLMLLPPNAKFLIATDYNDNRAEARERLVQRAIDADMEWIFWIDSDVLPPCTALTTLIGRDADIVGGLITTKSMTPTPLIMRRGTSFAVKGWQPGDLVECDGMGFGCTLMRTKIFKELDPPWFSEKQTSDGPLQPREWTEDLPLMYRAVDAGFKCYCDTSVSCVHVDWPTGMRFYWDLDRHAAVMVTPEGEKRMFPTAEQRIAYQKERDAGADND